MLPMRDDERTNEQLKIELLSQWKLEAEFRNILISFMEYFSADIHQDQPHLAFLDLHLPVLSVPGEYFLAEYFPQNISWWNISPQTYITTSRMQTCGFPWFAFIRTFCTRCFFWAEFFWEEYFSAEYFSMEYFLAEYFSMEYFLTEYFWEGYFLMECCLIKYIYQWKNFQWNIPWTLTYYFLMEYLLAKYFSANVDISQLNIVW